MRHRISTLHNSRVSGLLFCYESDDYDQYGLVARTGQTGTLVRASNVTALDRNGASRPVVHSQPAIQMYDLDGDGVREQPSLLLAADRVSFDVLIPVRADGMTMYTRAIEISTILNAADGFVYLGNDAVSGARFFLDGDGAHMRLTHHNGTSAVTSAMGVTAPAAGQLMEHISVFNANGSIQLHESINEGTVNSASASAAHTPAAAWGTVLRVRFNSTGSAGNVGNTAIIAVKILAGVGYDIHQLREAR